jgi:hypothetical protein
MGICLKVKLKKSRVAATPYPAYKITFWLTFNLLIYIKIKNKLHKLGQITLIV